MRAVTGYQYGECVSTTDCIQPDGSGFYIVRAFENGRGPDSDEHEFFGKDAFTTDFLRDSPAYTFSMKTSFDWLAARARGDAWTEPSRSPPTWDGALQTGVFRFCGFADGAFSGCDGGSSCRLGDHVYDAAAATTRARHFCCQREFFGRCKWGEEGGDPGGAVGHPCETDGQCHFNGCSANWLPYAQGGAGVSVEGRCRLSGP